MNTAATRLMSANAISLGKFNLVFLNRRGMWLSLLMLALFFSAFGIIYAKDLNRRLLIREQILERENIVANEQWGKLLLEQSTLARQSRIHHLAKSQLGMITPEAGQFEIIKAVKNG